VSEEPRGWEKEFDLLVDELVTLTVGRFPDSAAEIVRQEAEVRKAGVKKKVRRALRRAGIKRRNKNIKLAGEKQMSELKECENA